MLPNFLTLIGAAFIPMFIGYIYFHPSVFGGNKWDNLAQIPSDKRKDVSTIKLLLTIVLNFFIAFGLFVLCVHQFGAFSMVGGETELLHSGVGGAFMQEYGGSHLSFGHGALHGGFQGSLGFAIPILGYVTIFEHKSFKYFLTYLGYWIINLTLMGGCIGAWGAVAA